MGAKFIEIVHSCDSCQELRNSLQEHLRTVLNTDINLAIGMLSWESDANGFPIGQTIVVNDVKIETSAILNSTECSTTKSPNKDKLKNSISKSAKRSTTRRKKGVKVEDTGTVNNSQAVTCMNQDLNIVDFDFVDYVEDESSPSIVTVQPLDTIDDIAAHAQAASHLSDDHDDDEPCVANDDDVLHDPPPPKRSKKTKRIASQIVDPIKQTEALDRTAANVAATETATLPTIRHKKNKRKYTKPTRKGLKRNRIRTDVTSANDNVESEKDILPAIPSVEYRGPVHEGYRTRVRPSTSLSEAGGVVLECRFCSEKFPTKREWGNHEWSTHRDGIKFICTLCPFTTSKSTLLIPHIQQHETVPRFCCEICGEQFRVEKLMKRHVLEHTSPRQRKYPCTMCDKAYFHNYALIKHAKVVHENHRAHLCALCGFRSTTGYGLNVHILSAHTTEKTAKCQYCDYACKLESNLKLHMRKNHAQYPTEPVNYNCPHCSYTTGFKFALVRHLKHHGNKMAAQSQYDIKNETLQSRDKRSLNSNSEQTDTQTNTCD